MLSLVIAHQPDRIHLVQIHLIGIRDRHQITAVSVINRLGSYEFTPWSLDLVSVVRIRESPYYRGFFKIKYTRIFSGHWEVSALERCRTERFDCVIISLSDHVSMRKIQKNSYFKREQKGSFM